MSANSIDDILNDLFGSSTSAQSGVFTEKRTAAPTLGLSGPSKKEKETPKQQEYVSKFDKMEEGRMSTKVIRTQLVKGEKAENVQKKFEKSERMRLELILGKQALEKAGKKRSRHNQLASSDDDCSDIEPTSKLGLIKLQQQQQQQHGKQGKQLLNKPPEPTPKSTLLVPQVETVDNRDDIDQDEKEVITSSTPLTSKKKKNNKSKQKGQIGPRHDDEVVMLEAD
jgi:hypothetical protein